MKKIFAGMVTCLAVTSAFAQSPNERVHVLQKRDYSVKNKIEIGVFGGLTIGDVFTQQFSTAVAVDYHLNEAFALEGLWMSSKLPFAMGNRAAGSGTAEYSDPDSFRWGMTYTGAYDEVKNDAQLSPSNADLAMLGNYLGLSVQFSPIYGKWSLLNLGIGHADIFLTAGGGAASTEYRKANGNWVDTGLYFVGSFGAGFRIFLNRWLAIRLDLRDFTFAARVKSEGGTSTAASDDTKIRNSLFLMLGVSFLFGGEAPVEIWSPY
jgi:outer membrane beta-barrel protein